MGYLDWLNLCEKIIVVKRLEQLEKKYHEFIYECLNLGHMSKLEMPEYANIVHIKLPKLWECRNFIF